MVRDTKPAPAKEAPAKAPKVEDKTEKPEKTEPGDKVEKPEQDLDTTKMAPKALREAYDKLKREMKEREAKYSTEIETLRKTAPKDDPEKLELSTKYADLEKRHKAAEEKLRLKAYQESEEFQEKHYKPYVKQYQTAAAKMLSWKGVNDDGSPKDITARDFEEFMKFTSDDDAETYARKLFGSETKTTRAMTLRDEILRSEHNMREAQEEYRKTGEEREKQLQQQSAQQQEREAAMWKKLNTDAIEKFPQWFKAEEGDEKGAEILKNGFELADLAFSGTEELSAEKRLALHSTIRNHAAGFRYMVHKYEAAQARLAEVEKELAEYKKSEPGRGETAGDPKGEELHDPFARFEK